MAGFHIDEQCVRSLLGGGECGVGALPGMCFHLCPAHCSVRSPHRLPAQPTQQSNLHVCAVLPAREFARKPQRGRGAAHAMQGAVCAAALCSGNAVRCMAHRCIVASLPRCIVATLHRCIVASLHRCIVATLHRCHIAEGLAVSTNPPRVTSEYDDSKCSFGDAILTDAEPTDPCVSSRRAAV